MLLTSHAMLTFVGAKLIGLNDAEAAIVGVSAASNDIIPASVYFARRLAGDDTAQQYGKVYQYTHDTHDWMVLALLLAAVMFYLYGWTHTTATVALSFLAYLSHIGIDALWHHPDGGWYWWGIPADIIVHVGLIVTIVGWYV